MYSKALFATVGTANHPCLINELAKIEDRGTAEVVSYRCGSRQHRILSEEQRAIIRKIARAASVADKFKAPMRDYG
jgi:hypothetical protein